jgi:hypothetical protein
MYSLCQSQWPCSLRHVSAATCLLRLWVQILLGAWTSVSCECCVLSGRVPCVGVITHPEEYYWVWCVWVWSWSLDNQEALAYQGPLRHGKILYMFIILSTKNSRVPFFQTYNFCFTCRRAIGNCAWTSVVIHSRNVSCTFSVSTKASIASLQNGSDKCMFCSNTQPPPAIESDIRRRACISWPCPMDTDFRARNRNSTFIFNKNSNSAYRSGLWTLVKV